MIKIMHYINWGILLSLFQKILKIPKTTPVDGFQHVSLWVGDDCLMIHQNVTTLPCGWMNKRDQFWVVFKAQSNGEGPVQIS